MNELMKTLAEHLAQVLNLITMLLLAVGSLYGIWNLLGGWFGRKSPSAVALTVWQGLSRWILVALQFMLAADLVETIAAPTWDVIGKLGAIALIRTVLGYFLGRDMETARKFADEDRTHGLEAKPESA
jgi:uncharacterized membrane protein